LPALTAAAAAPAAFVLTLGAATLRVAGSSLEQVPWSATVAVAGVALVPSAGPGYACAADGRVDFVAGAAPSNGSSLVVTCQRQ
jgi:hypothetical protein